MKVQSQFKKQIVGRTKKQVYFKHSIHSEGS